MGGVLCVGENEDILYKKSIHINITYIEKDVDYYLNMPFCQSIWGILTMNIEQKIGLKERKLGIIIWVD